MKKIPPSFTIAVFALCLLTFALVRSQQNNFQTLAQTEAAKNTDCSNKATAQENQKNSNESEMKCDFSKYKTLKARSLKINSLPQPDYPAEAKKKKLSGCISVKILVNEEGSVVQSCVLTDKNSKRCSDPINDDLFKKLSEEAAAKAKFDVSRLNLGNNEFYETVIIYRFTQPK